MGHKAAVTVTGVSAAVAKKSGMSCIATLAFAFAMSVSASAQESDSYRGTQDQRMACMGDVFRLCSNDIPNVSRIVDCLVRERRQLTPACRAVFDQEAPRAASTRWARRHHHRMASRLRYERRTEQ
jgi:hypothetical protein